MTPREQVPELKVNMRRSVIGQEYVVERLLIGLLANAAGTTAHEIVSEVVKVVVVA